MNIWLSKTSLKPIMMKSQLTSVTVTPALENKLTLHYRGTVKTWILNISPGKQKNMVRVGVIEYKVAIE